MTQSIFCARRPHIFKFLMLEGFLSEALGYNWLKCDQQNHPGSIFCPLILSGPEIPDRFLYELVGYWIFWGMRSWSVRRGPDDPFPKAKAFLRRFRLRSCEKIGLCGFDPKGRVAFRNLRIAERSSSRATFHGSKTSELMRFGRHRLTRIGSALKFLQSTHPFGCGFYLRKF